MEIKRNILVKSTKHNKPILTDVFFKQNNKKKPLVIFCHGYKGYKDWGAWNLAAEKFAAEDFFFLKFNFSHNGGTAENPIDFPDLEAFGHNNFEIELDDLDDIINWITTSEYTSELDVQNITLIGHSRGGGIVTIKASENKKVSKIVSWNGVSDYGSRFPNKLERTVWKMNGVAYIENARTKQKMPHYYQFYTNFKENEERFTIENAAKKMVIPHLIIQGELDEVIPKIEAENLHKWNPNSKLVFIESMNHSLGCVQPWKKSEMPEFLSETVEKTIQFLKK